MDESFTELLISIDTDMSRRIAEKDWSKTTLGPIENWPQTLKQTVILVLENPFPAIIYWGSELLCIYNSAYSPLLNDKPEALGQSIWEVWHEYQSKLKSSTAKVLNGEQVFRQNRKFTINSNGYTEEIWFDYSLSPIRDEIGTVLGILSIAIEKSEQVRSAEALRENEERLRAMFDNHQAVKLVIEPDSGAIKDANRAAAKFYGYSREQLRTMRIQDINQLSDTEVAAERQKAASAERNYFVFPHRLANGEMRWVEVYSSRIPIHGQIFLYSIIHDITDRKLSEDALRESEEKFRSVFAQAAVGIGRVRFTDARWIDVNDAFCNMLGYSREEMLSTPWPEITHPDDVDLDLIPFRQMAAGQLKTYSVEKRFIHKMGRHVWAKLTLSLVRDSLGKPFYEIAIIENITSRKEAEESLRKLNEKLEERVLERTAEVQMQADQLRALANQLSQVEQRERKRLAQILHDHLQQLIVAARMQLELSNRYQDPAKLHAAIQGVHGTLQEALEASRSLAVELSPPVLHKAGLAGALNWLASRMDAQHQFHVVVRTNKRAEPTDEAMRFLLFECARELLLNSAKHSGVRQAEVVLRRINDTEIKLIVLDKGKGFDPDVLKKRRPDEVSFGLFSIRERLAHFGGRMEIESSPGEGTKVVLTAPVLEVSEVAAKDSAKTTNVEAGAADVLIRHKPDVCRVLVVDDHKIMREGITKLVEFESDIEVVGEAADGAQAVELAERLNPDVVIMDTNLGDMDGTLATLKILEKDAGIQVIGLSLSNDIKAANAMRDAGASAYLNKDGPAEELIETIHSCWKK